MVLSFQIAGGLALLLGLVHSVLGEILIFQNLRVKGNIVPTRAGKILKERHVRILWATWHLASIFGWCLGVILIYSSYLPEVVHFQVFMVRAIMSTMLTGALLVLYATKGRHPGWIVLLLIAIVLWIM